MRTSALPFVAFVLFALFPAKTSQAACGVETCVLHPELTEGPYWVDLELVRQNITEGKPGIPLMLAITVIDSNTCEVIPNAGVELWHCDSVGIYSHYEQASQNVQNPQTDNTTYLRGLQMTDTNGVATLHTIYPGWYNGRTIHIHLKVHLGGAVSGSSLVGSSIVHTGQLFMNDSLNTAVAQFSPYSSHGNVQLLKLDEDNIYLGGGSYGTLNVQFVNSALGYAGGLMATVTVAITNATSTSAPGGGGGGATPPGGSATPPSGTIPATTAAPGSTASPSSSTPTASSTTAAPTASPSTAAPTASPSTAAPTASPSTAAPTSAPEPAPAPASSGQTIININFAGLLAGR